MSNTFTYISREQECQCVFPFGIHIFYRWGGGVYVICLLQSTEVYTIFICILLNIDYITKCSNERC